MTETSALISVNRAGKTKLGTVGLPYYNVEVKTTNDGELICKGPNIMQGYFKKPELTAEVIDKDGFFHTGDIGVIDDKGFIKITGRKKEIFKTASGEFVSPKIIENKLKQSRFVQQIIVVGANESFLSALIIPEPDHLMNWCVENKIKFEDLKDVYLNSAVVKLFKNEIEKFNSTTLETEKIRKFEILSGKWTVESGELSSFMKLKRNYIEKKYKHEISIFYD